MLKVPSDVNLKIRKADVRNWRYSQTCSNDHLYKTTTRLRWPMLSLPKPIPLQSLLYKTTNCLTWPATIFLSPNEKKLSKTATAKLYPAKKMEPMHKNKRLSDYIYYNASLKRKLCLMFVKTEHLHLTYLFPVIVVVNCG